MSEAKRELKGRLGRRHLFQDSQPVSEADMYLNVLMWSKPSVKGLITLGNPIPCKAWSWIPMCTIHVLEAISKSTRIKIESELFKSGSFTIGNSQDRCLYFHRKQLLWKISSYNSEKYMLARESVNKETSWTI